MNFAISIFNNKSDNLPQQVVRSWPLLCQRFATPVVRQEKDGPLFSPARFVPQKRRAANVVEVSMLVLDCDHGIRSKEHLLTALRVSGGKHPLAQLPRFAFAIYSTHSHRQVTASNPQGEPRYRVVIPLAGPVPAEQFPALWLWAASIPGLHVDPQAKDASRIFYTPAKFCDEAPYEWHVEPGEFLDWRQAINVGQDNHDHHPAESHGARLGDLESDQKEVTQKPAGDTLTWPLRHEELTRRIMARGKRNARGVWDARCIAHGGKGETGLLFNPATNAVSCNAKCGYDQLLIAEGLPAGRLPDEPLAARVSAKLPSIENSPAPIVTAARLHVIYSLLLAHCLELADDDLAALEKHWGSDTIYGESVPWPDSDAQALVKVCSMPGFYPARAAARQLSEHFDLRGVPGFFYAEHYYAPQGLIKTWLLNLPRNLKPGALLAPYYSRGGYLVGIRIFRSWRDRGGTPWLLNSRGLPFGSRAVALEKEIEAA